MIKRGRGGGWAHWIVLWGFIAAAVFIGVKGLTEGLPKARRTTGRWPPTSHSKFSKPEAERPRSPPSF
jgi:hypothetical protein